MVNVCNLLEYNIQNIKYEYQTSDATLTTAQNQAQHSVQTHPGQLSMQSAQPQMRHDSTAFYASIGLRNISDVIWHAAQKGKQAVIEATANYARMGRQMGQIETGVTISEIYRQKLLQQSDTTLVVEQSAPVAFSYTPGSVQTQYTPSSVNINWNVERAMRNYTPPSFSLKVTRYPTVTFHYRGGYRYVPQSATPGFEARA